MAEDPAVSGLIAKEDKCFLQRLERELVKLAGEDIGFELQT